MTLYGFSGEFNCRFCGAGLETAGAVKVAGGSYQMNEDGIVVECLGAGDEPDTMLILDDDAPEAHCDSCGEPLELVAIPEED